MIGTQLAQFRIVAKIGEGGMGAVFRAEDTRLGREVALKMLPDAVAADPERRERFEREARILASLNHPHIAAIHQVAESDGRTFLVMELVEGDDLGERIAKGPLPIADALRIGRQIAEALEAAHGRGIIHRDLKPANVKLSASGQAKVLDFGLAKALDPAASGAVSPSQLAHSPTLTQGATMQGVILGTASYMSPEQARGDAVDRRADLWAFGLLLHEMLTGRQTYSGRTVTDVLAAVITQDPDLGLLPSGTPGQVRRLVERCTRKDAHERLHDAADARIAITEAIDRPELAPPAAGRATGGRRWGVALAAAAIGALVGAGLGTIGRTPEPARGFGGVVRLTLEVPDGIEPNDPFISPDGRIVAFEGTPAGGDDAAAPVPSLYLRALDSAEVRMVPGSEGVLQAAFSPDGESIAVLARDASTGQIDLRRLSIAGGPPVRLLTNTSDSFLGITWSDDDRILTIHEGGIVAVPTSGGPVVPVIDRARLQSLGSLFLAGAVPLPGGEKALVVYGRKGADGIVPRTDLLDLQSGERTTLFEEYGAGIVTRDLLVAWSKDAFLACRFDPAKGQVKSRIVPVLPRDSSLALSDNGVLVHRLRSQRTTTGLGLLGASGQFTPLESLVRAMGPITDIYSVRWSPEGDRLGLLVEDRDLRRKLFVLSLATGTAVRLGTDEEVVGNDLAWSPDGRSIAFSRFTSESGSYVMLQEADGASPARRIAAVDPDDRSVIRDEPAAWSPDGRTVAVSRHQANGDTDIYLIDVETGETRPAFASSEREHSPVLSPDGRWIAFQVQQSGRYEVFVSSFDSAARDLETRPRYRASIAGGDAPTWSADGRALRFVDPVGALLEVDVTPTGGRTLELAPPRHLFDFRTLSLSTDAPQNYDRHPDGKRFAVVHADETEGSSRNFEVVFGFDREIAAKLGETR